MPETITRAATDLASALAEKILGEVRFDRGSRALYATDASNYRQVPIGVVIPHSVEDVVNTVAVCRDFGAPILSRGGGTSLAGQCCNVAVVMDMSKYFNEILEINAAGKFARIRPGLVLDHLRHAAQRQGLTFGPDPATHNHCTLGGMMGNNSCGVHALMAGKTAENVNALEILTYDGHRMTVGETSDEEAARIEREGGRKAEIYRALRSLRDRYGDLIRKRFPDIPRCVSGYNLPALLPENGFNVARALIGSEGTCVTILEAKLRLVHNPSHRTLVVVGYRNIFEAADHIPDILHFHPIGLEAIDSQLIEFERTKHLNPKSLPLLPRGDGFLLVEFGADSDAEADALAKGMMAALKKKGLSDMRLFDTPAEAEEIWRIRESGLGATAFVPGQRDGWPGWEDAAVAPDKLGAYLREFHALLQRYDYQAALYGHFGQGCVHCRISFDMMSRPGVETYRRFVDEAADLVVKHGGSLSGEHGDGQSRAELLGKMFGPELLTAFREFKQIWDPAGKMNPGKIVDPNPITSHLRLGSSYNPPAPKTHFKFPEDGGDFSRSVLRCVGVGECRKAAGGVMCPSYQALREEEHSTRGRAHLLFEMLRGDVVKNGWKDDHVKESLDLCLACKGCKGECPVNVDMATYKAEFLSHYYEGRLRPRSAYAFGLIMWWARLASKAPGLVNFFTQTPPFSSIARVLAGAHPKRPLPRFASESFQRWADRRGLKNEGKADVILWPDTFNNYFHTGTAKSALDVLERLGYRVLIPPGPVCCGRPLYDYGFLDLAKRFLSNTLEELRPFIRRGVPIVGLEPSCVSVFRDELVNLFPHDKDARRLSQQTHVLSEFLAHRNELDALPRLPRRALVQGHCHHTSVLKFDAEKAVLSAMGLDHESLSTGCCGMAGAFGFEADKRDVSVQIAQRGLIPAVLSAPPGTLIMADGFSCRTQIEQLTGRKAHHLADALAMAYRQSGEAEETSYTRAAAAATASS